MSRGDPPTRPRPRKGAPPVKVRAPCWPPPLSPAAQVSSRVREWPCPSPRLVLGPRAADDQQPLWQRQRPRVSVLAPHGRWGAACSGGLLPGQCRLPALPPPHTSPSLPALAMLPAPRPGSGGAGTATGTPRVFMFVSCAILSFPSFLSYLPLDASTLPRRPRRSSPGPRSC